MMRSCLQDMSKPAVTALLDAVDKTMNGNAFLLKVQTDTFLMINNYQETLNHFRRSPLFQEMMIEQDQQRKWYNYTLWAPNAEDLIEIQHPPGNLVKEHFELICTS